MEKFLVHSEAYTDMIADGMGIAMLPAGAAGLDGFFNRGPHRIVLI